MYIHRALKLARIYGKPITRHEKDWYRNILTLERDIRIRNQDYCPMTPLSKLAHLERNIRRAAA